MKRSQAMSVLARRLSETISVATMRSIGAWYDAGGSAALHFDSSTCMGAASALGLGLALAQPDRRVVVLDGDASLLMQLGALAGIAEAAPANFYHFVFVNRVYESHFDLPVPAAARLDFAAIALGTGYRRAWSINDVAALREHLPAILAARGPVLVALEIEPHSDEGGYRWLRRALGFWSARNWRGLLEAIGRSLRFRSSRDQAARLRAVLAPAKRDR